VRRRHRVEPFDASGDPDAAFARLKRLVASAPRTVIVAASDDYQRWINKRHKGDWDDRPNNNAQFEHTIAGTLFGGAITKRLFGGSKNDDK